MKVGSYFAFDAIDVLSSDLAKQPDIGTGGIHQLRLYYHYPAIPASLFAGVLTDLIKPRRAALLFSTLVTVGSVLTAVGYAQSRLSTMLAGQLVFGVGCEALGISQLVILTRWFMGNELGLAVGVTISVQRLGSIGAAWALPQFADQHGTRTALWLVNGVVGASLATTLAFYALSSHAQRLLIPGRFYSLRRGRAGSWSPFGRCGSMWAQPGVRPWLVAAAAALFYALLVSFVEDSAIVLWRWPAASTERTASFLLWVCAAVSSPPAGFVLDRIGRRATALVLACTLTVTGLLMLALDNVAPAVGFVFIGIAYGVFASAIWSAAAILSEDGYEGTMLGIIFCLQNAAIVGVRLSMRMFEASGASNQDVVLVYACIGGAALFACIVLLVCDLWHARTLEAPQTDALQVFDDDDLAYTAVTSSFAVKSKKSKKVVYDRI